jgi:hypothetical protein
MKAFKKKFISRSDKKSNIEDLATGFISLYDFETLYYCV